MSGSNDAAPSGSLAAKLLAVALLAGLLMVAQSLVFSTVAPAPGGDEARATGGPAVRSLTFHAVRGAGADALVVEEVLAVTAKHPAPLASIAVTLTLRAGDEVLTWEGGAANGTLNLTVLRDRDRSTEAEPPRLSEGDMLRLRAALPAAAVEGWAAGGTLVRVLRAPGWAEAALEAPLARAPSSPLATLPVDP